MRTLKSTFGMFHKLIASLDPALALQTTMHLMITLGFVAFISFILSAHWILVLLTVPVVVFAWFILYKFEEGLTKRFGNAQNDAFASRMAQQLNAWKPGLK